MNKKNEIAKTNTPPVLSAEIEKVLIQGDLSGLSEPQRLQYVKAVCDSIGINMLTAPFEYIKLNNRLVLYAKKACAEQLRKIHEVSVTISSREVVGDVYVVTANARMPDGREDSSTGAVAIKGLAGEALANAYMKTETKAKRRVTLSICGLSVLDESEIGTESPNASDPLEGNGNTEPHVRGYRVPFGKYAQRGLEEIDLDDLRNYVLYLESAAEKEGKSMRAEVVEFISRAEEYIFTVENGDVPEVHRTAAEPTVLPPANKGPSRADIVLSISRNIGTLGFKDITGEIMARSRKLLKKEFKDLGDDEIAKLAAHVETELSTKRSKGAVA